MIVGETIKVIDHDIEGRRWTVGQVGYIKGPAHIQDFDNNYPGGKGNAPPVKEGYWLVSISNKEAKLGFAYAILPESVLPPHACTDRCGVHRGLLG